MVVAKLICTLVRLDQVKNFIQLLYLAMAKCALISVGDASLLSLIYSV